MSRSRRKVPKTAITTSTSEKEEKRDANRKLRRMTREKVKKGDEELPGIREVSDVWDFSKDGKSWKEDKKFLRK
jgi:hypothetical protein